MLESIDPSPLGSIQDFVQTMRDRMAVALGVPVELLSTPMSAHEYTSPTVPNSVEFNQSVLRMHRRVIRYIKLTSRRLMLIANHRISKRVLYRRRKNTIHTRNRKSREPTYATRVDTYTFRQRINDSRTAMSVYPVS